MSEIDRITDQLKRAFEGDAWHGPSVLEVLDGVTWERALTKPIRTAHSVWEVVLHMAAWEDIVARRLSGEDLSPTPEQDWPPIAERSEAGWARALEMLRNGHRRLRATASSIEDKLLDSPPVGKYSTRYVLLHGIIQHDLYHAGQIAVLKKQ
jgi:uncharacterized damage-inducible protein DinB